MVNKRLNQQLYNPLSTREQQPGVTLIELIVVLAVLSILSAIALPYAEVTVKRKNEFELRYCLRQVRTAIDEFHEDWKRGRISGTNPDVSEDGYPKTLMVMVEGVEFADAKGSRHKYLRHIPPDPMDQRNEPPQDQWRLISYRDSFDSRIWGGEDVYDVRSKSDKTAIDGTAYRDW
jgi:general secretion pathway protein G